MFPSKTRLLGLVLGVLLVGGAIVLWSAFPRTHAADAKDSKVKALLTEKLGVLQEVASRTTKAYQVGSASFAEVLEANQAVRGAELDLCDTDKERIAVLEKKLEEAKEFEKKADQQMKAGTASPSAVLKAKVNRLDVEIALERIKGK